MELATVILGLALAIVGYLIISTLRAILFPPKPVVIKYNPPHVGDITLEEMSKCTGEDPFRPILFAVRGQVYDVTEGRAFYGPGGAYHVFAGREVSRALARMVVTEAECTGDLSDVDERQMATLQDWEAKLGKKYKIVGQVSRRPRK